MSVVRELVTKLSFAYENSGLKKFVGEMRKAKTQTKADVGEIKSSLLSLKNLVVGFVSISAGGSVMRIADEWASVSGRIKLATKDAEEHKYAMDEIYSISQRTGQAMSATGDLFQKVARNQQSLGLQTQDTLKLTEIIGQTLTIGGGDENSNSAGLLQLGQALAAGKLSGDELNSIIEQTPRLAEAIANSFGIGVGQLKEMGKQGKLTAKELAQGLLKQADKIQKEFDSMPKTFSNSMTKLKNAFGRFISFAVNDVLHLGDAFSRLASWIEENIKLVLILATSAIAGKLMLAIRGAQGGVKALGATIWKAMAPMLPWIALFTVIGLLIEDIYVWMQGGDTLAGRLFGDFGDWKRQFNEVERSAKMLWLSIKGLFNELLALTGADFRIDFSSWRDGASAALQYIIDSIKQMLNFFRSIVRTIRSLIRGDFSGAFIEAGTVIDNFSKLGVVLIGIIIAKIISMGAALKAAMSVNPILLVFGLIIALITSIIVYWDEIRAVAEATWEVIKAKANEMWDAIKAYAYEVWKSLTDSITNLWRGVTSVFSDLWSGAIDKVTGFLNAMIPQGVKDFFSEIAAFFGSDSDKNINVNVNGNLAALQQSTGSRAYNSSQTNHIEIHAANNPSAVANAVKNTVTSFKSGYSIRSPEVAR